MLSMAAGPHAPPIAIAVEAAGVSLIVPEDGLLVHGGTFLPVGMLSLWLRMNGMAEGAKPVRVPNVEAGSYMFCPPGDGAASLIRGGPPLSGSCTAGIVQPYGELSLLPPAPAATR
jgi:hypothetical protein